MKNLIKIVNPVLVSELANAGFSYITVENIGSKQTFVFMPTTELLEFINNNFDNKEIIFDNTLNF